MSDINLLPEQQRSSERREHQRASSQPASQPVTYTPGQRGQPQPQQRSNFLTRLFARPPATPPRAPEPSAPRPQTSAAGTRSADRVPFWRRWFTAPAVPAALEPPAAATPPSTRTPRSWRRSWKSFLPRKESEAPPEPGRAPMTSLLPKEYLRAGRHTVAYVQLALSLLLSGGALALSFWLLLGYETIVAAQLEQARADLSTVDREIATLDGPKRAAMTLQRKIAAARTLLDVHLHWTRALALLERTAIADVQYRSIAVDARTMRVGIDARGRSFAALARQLTVFQNAPEVKRISITSGKRAGVEEAGVDFSIDLELLPAVLRQTPEHTE